MEEKQTTHGMADGESQIGDGVCEIAEGIQFIDKTDIPDRDGVRTVILPKFTVQIREGALAGMPNLERVVARGMVYRVCKRAFQGCPCLREVVLPHVEFIDDEAFADCTSLERVVIGKAVKVQLGRYLFSGAAEAFTIEYAGTCEQFKSFDRAVVGQKTVGYSGDYHHPSSSHFEELKANIYAPVFSARSGKFVCTVKCADGELTYPSVDYSEWVD